MEKNTQPLISQTKLNMLYERVCRRFNYLTTKITSATPLWDGPIDMCRQIEDDYFAVENVIMEAKKSNNYFNGSNTPRLYNAILCRVYILLYYRHRDDKLYQEIVFPRLRENMGIYHSNHQKEIDSQIDQILTQEEMVENAKKQQAVTSSAMLLSSSVSSDLATLRKQFINSLNAGAVEVDSVDWADATMGFDRAVMKELFWGVEDDKFLKTIINAIINTWNKLVKAKDNRCLMNTPGAASMAIAASLDQWKFGGLMRETINKFFDDLWVERNARKTYANFGTDEAPVQQKTMSQNDNETVQQLTESRRVNAEQNLTIKKLMSEIEKLKSESTVNVAIEKDFDDVNKWAKVIFFATVLNAAYQKKFTVGQQLALFICLICGGKPSTYQPLISKIATMEDNEKDNSGDSYSPQVIKAATEIVNRLVEIPEGDSIHPTIQGFIDSICDEFSINSSLKYQYTA